MSNNPNNSIDELLEIFKYYRSEAKSNEPQSFNLFDSPLQTGRNKADITHDQFSFSKQLPKLQYGTHSSLQKVDKLPQRLSSTRRKSNYYHQTHDSIFNRLYEEVAMFLHQNKKIRQKRERLFQQGRRSLEKQQTKECTFAPNTKSTKVKTQRSFNADDCEGFYIKNMEWQNRREISIKKQQCERNSEERKELTFAPKINPYRKKGTDNKENQFMSTKKKADSYLHNYHKVNHKELGQTSARAQNKGTFHLRQGYFSYIN